MSHHGGWYSEKSDGAIGSLVGNVGSSKPSPVQLAQFTKLLNDIVCELDQNWPLVAYTMRVLRLADQLATEEANSDR